VTPLDSEIERLESRVLCAWIGGPGFRSRYTPSAELYWSLRHQAVAGACQAVSRLGKTPWRAGDLSTAVLEQLSATGELRRLWGLGDSPLTEVQVQDPDQDLVRLRELAALRDLRRKLQPVLLALGPGSDLTAVRSEVAGALSAATIASPMVAHSQAGGLARVIVAASEPNGEGSRSGMPTLDRLVGGIRPGHCWVVGAPTNWGKTSLAIAIADAYPGLSLLVTCEDAPELVFQRLLARRASVAASDLRDGKFSSFAPSERDRIADTLERAKEHGDLPFVLDGRGHSVERISDWIRIMLGVHPIGLVLVDYLQCISTDRKTEDRRNEVNHIARTLTDAIKTRNAAGILTSQLTGEDIRESRDVEHAAEIVLIGRKNKSRLTLYVKKNKSGPADAVLAMTMHPTTGALYESEPNAPTPHWNERNDS
jgi:KaiC/GvpD/RAD55 family RecA-like ATPase